MKFIQLEGMIFGRLHVINFAGANAKGDSFWVCMCNCGKVRKVRGRNLRSGNTTSCGCYQKERASASALRQSGIKRKLEHLPEKEIVRQLLDTNATTRSLAKQYDCCPTSIGLIYQKYTSGEQRLNAKIRKQAKSLRGYKFSSERRNAHSKKMEGGKNPFYGKKHTIEFRKRQALNRLGKKGSLDSRIAQSARLQGILKEQWIGFATTEKLRARHSGDQKKWRNEVFKRDNYTCRLCGKREGNLHPHHIKVFAKYPELRFQVCNGVTLCATPCHKQTIGKEEQYENFFKN